MLPPQSDHLMRRRGGIRQRAQLKSSILRVIVIGAVLIAASWPASAATDVRGEPQNVQLRAENASTKEVLDALSAKFKLNYKLPPTINRSLTGIYSGSLRQVLARILDGNDYIVISNDSVEVVVLGASAVTSVAPGTSIARVENLGAPVVSSATPSVPTVPGTSPPGGPVVASASPPPPLATYLPAP